MKSPFSVRFNSNAKMGPSFVTRELLPDGACHFERYRKCSRVELFLSIDIRILVEVKGILVMPIEMNYYFAKMQCDTFKFIQ